MQVELLESVAKAAATSLRMGMTAQGSEALARFVDLLLPHLASDPALAARCSSVLTPILGAQERGDVLGVADGLEHELLPILRAP